MEEKEKIEATSSEEDTELTPEEEEAAIHWKTQSNRLWLSEEGELKAPVEQAPEDEEEARMVMEDARRRAEEVPEEEMHPSYKKMMGMASASGTEKADEEVKIRYVKCGDCGAMVLFEELQDNGSYLACKKCC